MICEKMAETETLVNPQLSAEDEDTDVKKPSVGSESDSESEDEAQAQAQLDTQKTALQSNPADYDTNVQYIKLLRKLGDIEKLRQAREAMSTLFPLTPEMWQEWANDEINSFGEDAFSAVENLYERGVSDYLSVSLWCDYLNFVQKCDPLVCGCSAVGISKARNLFERALTAAGLHVTEGHMIWELYRKFEQAVFLTIEETDTGSKEKQTQRIRNLFHRQLSVPLAEVRSTLLIFKAWEANQGSAVDVNSSELDGLQSNVVSIYQKALEMLNARAHLEEQISKKDGDTEKLQEFMTYLKFEHSSGDPARIQILYERAITEFPLCSDLWLDYTQYLDKTFKTARIVRDAYYRATRNCHWVGELWVRYLLSLERSCSSEEELTNVFEKSLLCTFSSFDEYLNIFLTRVDGLRRRISAFTQMEDGVNYAVIRDIFQRASDYLSPNLKNTESLLQMYSYWARLELKLGKNLIAARGVWESLLKISGSMLEAWQCYLSMETDMGHMNEARSLYKRCYSKKFSGTGSEDLCHSWVRFEREYGSLEDFDIAVQKVTPRLQELQLFRLQQETKSSAVSTDERKNSSKKSTREKRKSTPGLIDEQSPTKCLKDMDHNLKKTNKNDKGLVTDSVTNESDELHDNKSETASNKETKDKSSKKSVPFDDQCTAFLSNLSFEATEDDLRNFFVDVGGVVDIRILKDKITRKSRGLAYVDFSDDAHLASALEKNKQIMLGKRISILKSDPQQGRKKNVAGRGTSSNHGKKDSQEVPPQGRGKGSVQLKGKNTFAVPRTVKALGWSSSSVNKPQSEGANEQGGDETPKSNDEFRKMFIKN